MIEKLTSGGWCEIPKGRTRTERATLGHSCDVDPLQALALSWEWMSELLPDVTLELRCKLWA